MIRIKMSLQLALRGFILRRLNVSYRGYIDWVTPV